MTVIYVLCLIFYLDLSKVIVFMPQTYWKFFTSCLSVFQILIMITLQIVNLVDLRTIGIADSPIIVDRSPPVAGKVNDGEIYKVDLDYTMYPDKVSMIYNCYRLDHLYE